MSLIVALSPRDPKIAARMLTALVTSGAVALAIRAVVDPGAPHPGIRWTVAGALVVVGGLLGALPTSRLTQLGLWFGVPVLGVAAWSALAVLTEDLSPGTHAFLTLPVVFAAAQLRPRAAVAVTACTVLAEAAAFFALQPPAAAAVDLTFTCIALLVMSGLLIRVTARQERLVAQLEQLAAVDTLTGLVSRRVLEDALASAVSAGSADEGTALLLVDVDRFKTINDTHGHPVGDQALVHIAGVLSRSVRARDAVVSRIGGDEMAVLLPGCSTDDAVRRAEDLVAAVRRLPMLLADGTELPLSVSVGVAYAPRQATHLDSLYGSADEALYRAKREGRDRFAVAASIA